MRAATQIVPDKRAFTHGNRHSQFTYAPLGLLLVLFLMLLYASGAVSRGPDGRALGSDFAMYWGATHVLEHGGNPFEPSQLYRTEQHLLQQNHIPIMRSGALVRVGNPPLLYWMMQPLTAFTFTQAAIAWMAAMYLLEALAFLALLRYFRWRTRLVPLIAFLAMPQVVLSVFYGNVTGLVLASLCFSFVLARQRPALAGALATVACLKPQVALPTVLLIGLFTTRSRPRFIVGFAATLGLLIGLTLLTTGMHATADWLQALNRYSGEIAAQPNLSSLAGIYARVASSQIRLVLEMASLAAASALTLFVWLRTRHRLAAPYQLFVILSLVWFLATPYAHFPDEVFLTLPVLMCLGRNARHIFSVTAVMMMYLAALSVLLFSWAPFHVQLLWAPLAVVLVAQAIGSMRAPATQTMDAFAA